MLSASNLECVRGTRRLFAGVSLVVERGECLLVTGPNGCEVTGVITTPDGRTMFVNIQHPGEAPSERSDPAKPTAFSSWPDGAGAGRPRSATIVIRKRDGGVIGT